MGRPSRALLSRQVIARAALEVVDQALHEPWLAVLATYLGGDTEPPDAVRQARRLSAVGHLGSLFDRYALHRPTMIDAWRRGEDVDTAVMQAARG